MRKQMCLVAVMVFALTGCIEEKPPSSQQDDETNIKSSPKSDASYPEDTTKQNNKKPERVLGYAIEVKLKTKIYYLSVINEEMTLDNKRAKIFFDEEEAKTKARSLNKENDTDAFRVRRITS